MTITVRTGDAGRKLRAEYKKNSTKIEFSLSNIDYEAILLKRFNHYPISVGKLFDIFDCGFLNYVHDARNSQMINSSVAVCFPKNN